MTRQIRKNLLPHQVSYKQYLQDTGEGSSYAASITLYNVKIEEVKQVSHTKDGREIIGNALMFYDFRVSSGLTNDPTENSQVIFNNRTYHIATIDTLRDRRNNPHHYEIILK